MREELNKKLFYLLECVRNLEWYLSMPKFLAFRTSHVGGVCLFGVSNVKYLAFDT